MLLRIGFVLLLTDDDVDSSLYPLIDISDNRSDKLNHIESTFSLAANLKTRISLPTPASIAAIYIHLISFSNY